ncbi:hypothetical protein D5086_021975 [Populus alba]|uniref:Uncharacterized protein n=1 Tax=Populus alba TaxID=43335 RepID=A0ACC4BEB4_POPAL
MSSVSSKEYSTNGSSSSSSSHLEDVLDSLTEIDDRLFALPRTNSLKPMQHEEKINLANLGSGSFDWATLAGLNSLPELLETQPGANYSNTDVNGVHVPSMPPLCHADSSTGRMGTSVEEEVQSGVRTQLRDGNSGAFQKNSGVMTPNFSSTLLDPYELRFQKREDGGRFINKASENSLAFWVAGTVWDGDRICNMMFAVMRYIGSPCEHANGISMAFFLLAVSYSLGWKASKP